MKAPGGERQSEAEGCTDGPCDDVGKVVGRDGDYSEDGDGKASAEVMERVRSSKAVIQIVCTVLEGKINHCSKCALGRADWSGAGVTVAWHSVWKCPALEHR